MQKLSFSQPFLLFLISISIISCKKEAEYIAESVYINCTDEDFVEENGFHVYTMDADFSKSYLPGNSALSIDLNCDDVADFRFYAEQTDLEGTTYVYAAKLVSLHENAFVSGYTYTDTIFKHYEPWGDTTVLSYTEGDISYTCSRVSEHDEIFKIVDRPAIFFSENATNPNPNKWFSNKTVNLDYINNSNSIVIDTTVVLGSDTLHLVSSNKYYSCHTKIEAEESVYIPLKVTSGSETSLGYVQLVAPDKVSRLFVTH